MWSTMMMAISLRNRSKVSNNCSTTVVRQALERLVEQQYPHVAGQRAGHRDHLLLAAGEVIGGLSSRSRIRGKYS